MATVGKRPRGGLFCLPWDGAFPEQIEAAERGRQAHATYMKKITDEQDEKRHYYLPKLKAPCSRAPSARCWPSKRRTRTRMDGTSFFARFVVPGVQKHSTATWQQPGFGRACDKTVKILS